MRHTPTVLALVAALGGMLVPCAGGDPTRQASTDREPPVAAAAHALVVTP